MGEVNEGEPWMLDEGKSSGVFEWAAAFEGEILKSPPAVRQAQDVLPISSNSWMNTFCVLLIVQTNVLVFASVLSNQTNLSVTSS